MSHQYYFPNDIWITTSGYCGVTPYFFQEYPEYMFARVISNKTHHNKVIPGSSLGQIHLIRRPEYIVTNSPEYTYTPEDVIFLDVICPIRARLLGINESSQKPSEPFFRLELLEDIKNLPHAFDYYSYMSHIMTSKI